MRLRALLVLAVVAALLAGCTSNSVTDGSEGGSFVFVSPGGKTEFAYPVAERKTIGDFTGTSVSDEQATIKLSDYPGSVLVLNVWGSWCAPCVAEVPDLIVVSQLSAPKGVQFLGINVKDSRQAAADFIAGRQVPFPSIFDPTMRTLLSVRGFPTSGIPSTFVLDREHRVAHIFLGAIGVQKLDAVVAAVAAEAPAP
jgi:thiol-disulfide isomerase/thioredoxin